MSVLETLSKEGRREFTKAEEEIIVCSRKGDLNRARSFSVGVSLGGQTELSVRRNDGTTVWIPLQTVEIIGLIHQLAANVGCNVEVQPREDSSSGRSGHNAN